MMDINDQNTPRSEGRPEGSTPSAAEGNKPREGKRPQGRSHHRRSGNRPQNNPQGDNAAGKQNANRPAAQSAEAAAPAAPAQKPTETNAGGKSNRPDRKKPSGGNRPDRRAGDRPAPQPADPKPEESRTASDESKAASPRPSGSRPSAGRPQRAPRHATQQTDLPNMNDLLIDDAMTAVEREIRAEENTDTDEIERILAHDVFARIYEPIPEVIPEDKVVIVGVRFRTGGKTYFFNPGALSCRVGQYAIVETARGQEFGEICIANRLYDRDKLEHALSSVLRIATEADIRHSEENREREDAAFRIGVQKIMEHKLDMKLVSVQYTFDNAKLLFYFTSAKRVDFRDLVKDLAGVFHIRIELRQIGIRDEARMIGGLGACGRPLCCSTFLNDFGQVSMKMAKEQNLSLNSSKISGCCGRLMCCLRYEYETYAEELRRIPAAGTFVNTPDGPGVVTEVYPLQGEVKVSLRGSETAPKRYSRDVIELQQRTRPDAGPARPTAVEEDPTGSALASVEDTPVAPKDAPAED